MPLADELIAPSNFVTRSGTIRSPNPAAKPKIPQRHISATLPLGSAVGTIFAVASAILGRQAPYTEAVGGSGRRRPRSGAQIVLDGTGDRLGLPLCAERFTHFLP